jgi:hypothetical protein
MVMKVMRRPTTPEYLLVAPFHYTRYLLDVSMRQSVRLSDPAYISS